MPAYHPSCREKADPGKKHGVREAKWPGRCVACGESFPKGTIISFSRDNVNGARRGTAKSEGAIPTASEASAADDDGGHEAEREAVIADAVNGASPAVQALAREMLPIIQAATSTAVDVDKIFAIARRAAEEYASQHTARVEVVLPTGETKDVGRQHRMFPMLLQAVAAGCNVWLTGPAGSGKTTAAKMVAKALGRPFSFTGSCTDPYPILGYYDAQGRYVRTLARDRWEHGGVHLFDEVDGWDPQALIALNAMTANGIAAFPDSMVERHGETSLIAAANTWGSGPDATYVGRAKQDAAALDRWVMIHWEIDEELERATSGDESWCRRVQEIRRRVREKGIRHLVTPRATYAGVRLLAAGLDRETVEVMTIRKGMTDEQWKVVA